VISSPSFDRLPNFERTFASRIQLSVRCTFAVTDAVPVNLNLQLFTSSPWLEQAPVLRKYSV
jgi:hypothetical protein